MFGRVDLNDAQLSVLKFEADTLHTVEALFDLVAVNEVLLRIEVGPRR